MHVTIKVTVQVKGYAKLQLIDLRGDLEPQQKGRLELVKQQGVMFYKI